jgi:hypothetical protein
MVLHKTTQHGSTCFFNSAKELNNDLLLQGQILCFAAADGIGLLA